jgi:hypothetical protein
MSIIRTAFWTSLSVLTLQPLAAQDGVADQVRAELSERGLPSVIVQGLELDDAIQNVVVASPLQKADVSAFASVSVENQRDEVGAASLENAGASRGADDEPQRWHIGFGADFASAYFFRGIRQETKGFICQPYVDFAVDVYRSENATWSLKLGMWNSYHGAATLSTSSDSFLENCYECDMYAGVGLATGKWAFDARYICYSSPSGAFGTINELDFSVSFDDSEFLGAWSLKPSITLASESGSFAADGGQTGTYLQLGIAPGLSFDACGVQSISLTFPVVVGLSLSDYYEGLGGENDSFGFASLGAKVAVPLTSAGSSFGAWTFSGSVQWLILGDAAASFNNSSHEVIGTVGVSAAF